MYSPTVRQISVLKLEKRLDDRLFYLRDAPPEYSTVPFDMEPVILPPGLSVPVNQLMVSGQSIQVQMSINRVQANSPPANAPPAKSPPLAANDPPTIKL